MMNGDAAPPKLAAGSRIGLNLLSSLR